MRVNRLVSLLVVWLVIAGIALYSQTRGSPFFPMGKTESSPGHPGGTLTVALQTDIVSLDPAFAYDFSTMPVVCQITEGLLRFDQNSRLVPNLAEKWEMKDARTYLYTIRKDVRFHDGTPMTSDDVVFSLKRIMDEQTGSYLAWMYRNVESIEKIAEWTVQVKLKQPDALWKFVPATTAGHVISKKHFLRHQGNIGNAENGVVGTGPFRFAKWETGSEIVLKRNANYWNQEGGPYLDEVIFRVVPDKEAHVTAVKSGHVKATFSLPVDVMPEIERLDNVTVQQTEGFVSDFIAFNTKRKPFDEIQVRKAFSYAFDHDRYLEEIVKSYGIPAKNVPIHSNMWTYEKHGWESYYRNLPRYVNNLEKAKEYLAHSSVSNGFSAKILTDNTPINLNAALALKAAVKPLGIELKIEKVTRAELTQRSLGGTRDYDIIVHHWGADMPDPLGSLLPLFHSDYVGSGGANYANYQNPNVDWLISEASSQTSEVKRAKQILYALTIIALDSPWIVLDHPKQILVMNRELEGYTISPLWYWDSFTRNIRYTGSARQEGLP